MGSILVFRGDPSMKGYPTDFVGTQRAPIIGDAPDNVGGSDWPLLVVVGGEKVLNKHYWEV